MANLNIGAVAAQSGVTVEAIRFYEKQKLIPEAPRSTSGYRQYSDETVKRVQFIQKAKDVGFSLKEIQSLLTLEASSEASCADVKAQALAKLAEVSARLRELRKIQRALKTLVERCDGSGPLTDCPILDALNAN